MSPPPHVPLVDDRDNGRCQQWPMSITETATTMAYLSTAATMADVNDGDGWPKSTHTLDCPPGDATAPFVPRGDHLAPPPTRRRTSKQGIAANAKAPSSALPPTPLSRPRASTIVCPAADSSLRKQASTPVRPRRRLVVAPASKHRPLPRRRIIVAPTSEDHRWLSDDQGGSDTSIWNWQCPRRCPHKR